MKFNWAVAGCGAIAAEMAQALNAAGAGVCGVYGRTPGKTEAFAEKYRADKIYKSFEELLSDSSVDIVYVATPHNSHYEYSRAALNAGKHVLAEKSATVNSAELRELTEIAARRGLIFAEAMTIYHMPLYGELKRRLDAGAVGTLKSIQITFGLCFPQEDGNRFYSPHLAGGALLDIGVYALAFSRQFLPGIPGNILTTATLTRTGVDENSVIVLRFGGVIVNITLGLLAEMPQTAVISGDRGHIEVYSFPRADSATIFSGGIAEKIRAGSGADAMLYEIEDMQRSVKEKRSYMSLEKTADVMEIMTAVRNQWGIKYPFEQNRK